MGVSSQLIYDELDSSVEKRLIKKDELLHIIEDESIEVLITLGAGDINTFVPFIKNILLKKL